MGKDKFGDFRRMLLEKAGKSTKGGEAPAPKPPSAAPLPPDRLPGEDTRHLDPSKVEAMAEVGEVLHGKRPEDQHEGTPLVETPAPAPLRFPPRPVAAPSKPAAEEKPAEAPAVQPPQVGSRLASRMAAGAQAAEAQPSQPAPAPKPAAKPPEAAKRASIPPDAPPMVLNGAQIEQLKEDLLKKADRAVAQAVRPLTEKIEGALRDLDDLKKRFEKVAGESTDPDNMSDLDRMEGEMQDLKDKLEKVAGESTDPDNMSDLDKMEERIQALEEGREEPMEVSAADPRLDKMLEDGGWFEQIREAVNGAAEACAELLGSDAARAQILAKIMRDQRDTLFTSNVALALISDDYETRISSLRTEYSTEVDVALGKLKTPEHAKKEVAGIVLQLQLPPDVDTGQISEVLMSRAKECLGGA